MKERLLLLPAAVFCGGRIDQLREPIDVVLSLSRLGIMRRISKAEGFRRKHSTRKGGAVWRKQRESH